MKASKLLMLSLVSLTMLVGCGGDQPNPDPTPEEPTNETQAHKISIGETGNLFGDFPNTSISIDTAGKFEYVSGKISEKLDSDLKNINSSAMKEIATLASPKSDNYSTIINNTVYQAPYSGYITVFNKSANTLIYNSHNHALHEL